MHLNITRNFNSYDNFRATQKWRCSQARAVWLQTGGMCITCTVLPIVVDTAVAIFKTHTPEMFDWSKWIKLNEALVNLGYNPQCIVWYSCCGCMFQRRCFLLNHGNLQGGPNKDLPTFSGISTTLFHYYHSIVCVHEIVVCTALNNVLCSSVYMLLGVVASCVQMGERNTRLHLLVIWAEKW